MKDTRTIVRISVIAALYAVMTIALAPISYGMLQFRISEFLKVFVLYNPWLSIGIGIGTFFANLASPYVGPLELVWMPLTDMAGGVLAWFVYKILRYRYAAAPMALYALTTSLAVAAMLYALGVAGGPLVALSILVSELVILIGAIPVVKFIAQWVNLT